MTFGTTVSILFDELQDQKGAKEAERDRLARNEHQRNRRAKRFCQCNKCQVNWFKRRLRGSIK